MNLGQTKFYQTLQRGFIAGREALGEVERKCTECKKRRAKPMTQIMASLPHSRTEVPIRAFEKVGLAPAQPSI